ncbi:MAG: hypothetical protein IPJ87_05295 [Flavobacteriales bacterium]|jgi:hypothetical protein|nr:hypothetical protein [Flavobacteriales bacterium]MBK7941276.1 hypothetical protein [Flavobacteriales bacterium]MBK8948645.1 hypothetical protein [Flavobacteriales bacterium]MBK9701302.1 hypothetical protein [Flavobacteriales bacterium]
MKRALLLTPVLLFTMHRAYAQGCSDAGVCTAGPLGEPPLLLGDSAAVTNEPRHLLRLTFSYAVGEQGTTVIQEVAELSLGLTRRLGLHVRLPFQQASGELGSVSGVGDPVATLSYAAWRRDPVLMDGRKIRWRGARRLDVLLGVKAPSNQADATTDDGKPLPMPYQTSLGTTDLLAGIHYRHDRWTVAMAYQQVLVHHNENRFSHEVWMDDMRAAGYFESAFLQRASDAVVRLQYAVPIGRVTVQPGLLAIVHLGQDRRLATPTDTTLTHDLLAAVEEGVPGSEGLTLNVTVDARWRLSDRWALELSYGSPLVTRTVRPDGLTRSLVANLGLAYRFGR